MHRVKLSIALLASLIYGDAFCADYTQHEDFGAKKAGDIVSFTVTPPGRVLTGRVDNPGGLTWVGGPESWTGTIPPDFAGVHNGFFSGTYQPPGEGSGSREYTWELDTKAMVGFGVDGVINVYGGTNVQIGVGNGKKVVIDGRDYNLPLDFYCSGAGCNGTLSTNPVIPGVFSAKPVFITGNYKDKIIGGIITNGTSQCSYWQKQVATLIPQAIPLSDKINTGTLGTWNNPEVVLVRGDTTISGSVPGAGILIVMPNGNITLTGNCHYEGRIILMGDNNFSLQGNASIFGAVVVIGDNVNIQIQGSLQIMQSLKALANAAELMQ